MPSGTLKVVSHSHMELVDITSEITNVVKTTGISNATLILFNLHTTAGLTINEGADPAVQTDIIAGLRKIVPLDHPFKHMEGNSPSHIMATLTGCSLTVFIEDGRLILGAWQRIFFCEYDGPRTRTIKWHITKNL
ncbi:MAG: secondary thiamine-phosphate synthase enzyme YjbQ [Desulfopila sp.]